jgi:hypothetical protein
MHTEGKLIRSGTYQLISADGSVRVAEALGGTGRTFDVDRDTAIDNARRLTAAWNSVEGIETADVERINVNMLVACVEELLSDVCDIAGHEKPSAYRAVNYRLLENLRAALAGIGEEK